MSGARHSSPTSARRHGDHSGYPRARTHGDGVAVSETSWQSSSARDAYAFLHWHIAFPAVWDQGGFDVVLGNPPWEHTELKEKEFFATRAHVSPRRDRAARKRMIDALTEEDLALHS